MWTSASSRPRSSAYRTRSRSGSDSSRRTPESAGPGAFRWTTAPEVRPYGDDLGHRSGHAATARRGSEGRRRRRVAVATVGEQLGVEPRPAGPRHDVVGQHRPGCGAVADRRDPARAHRGPEDLGEAVRHGGRVQRRRKSRQAAIVRHRADRGPRGGDLVAHQRGRPHAGPDLVDHLAATTGNPLDMADAAVVLGRRAGRMRRQRRGQPGQRRVDREPSPARDAGRHGHSSSASVAAAMRHRACDTTFPVRLLHRYASGGHAQLQQRVVRPRPRQACRFRDAVPVQEGLVHRRYGMPALVGPPAQIRQELADVGGRVAQTAPVEVEQVDAGAVHHQVVALEVPVRHGRRLGGDPESTSSTRADLVASCAPRRGGGLRPVAPYGRSPRPGRAASGQARQSSPGGASCSSRRAHPAARTASAAGGPDMTTTSARDVPATSGHTPPGPPPRTPRHPTGRGPRRPRPASTVAACAAASTAAAPCHRDRP